MSELFILVQKKGHYYGGMDEGKHDDVPVPIISTSLAEAKMFRTIEAAQNRIRQIEEMSQYNLRFHRFTIAKLIVSDVGA